MRFIVPSYAYQLDSKCRKLSTQAENYSKATNKSSLKNNQRGELLWYYEMRQLFSMQVVSNLNVEAWNVHPPVSRLLKTCVLMSHTDNSCLFVYFLPWCPIRIIQHLIQRNWHIKLCDSTKFVSLVVNSLLENSETEGMNHMDKHLRHKLENLVVCPSNSSIRFPGNITDHVDN